MFRSMRGILSVSRLPLRTQVQHQNGQIQNIQRVKFQRRIWRPKNIMISMIIYYTLYQVYDRVVFGQVDNLDMDDLPGDEEEGEEEEDLFLPLPGTYKLLNPVPYAASDPEWKGFVKFSKDKDAAKRVRDDLAAHVLKLATTHPMLSVQCGKDMKLRRYWLDVDFPPAAPPEYERSGIEFPYGEWPRWTTRHVDSLTVHKIQAVIWPIPMVQASWAFAKVAVSDQIGRFAGILGLRANPPPPTFEQILSRHQQISKNTQIPSENGSPQQPTTIGDGPKAIRPRATGDQPALKESGQQDIDISSITSPGAELGTELRSSFFRPILAFKKKFAQTWRPAAGYPPRGSIIVSGLVEVDSPKAWLVFDVKATYDPKEKEFDGQNMTVALRRFQVKKQGPMGRAPLPPFPPPMAGRPY